MSVVNVTGGLLEGGLPWPLMACAPWTQLLSWQVCAEQGTRALERRGVQCLPSFGMGWPSVAPLGTSMAWRLALLRAGAPLPPPLSSLEGEQRLARQTGPGGLGARAAGSLQGLRRGLSLIRGTW